MRDWGKVAVREGGGGTDVVANVFARGRVVLDDDKGGGGAVGGEGGLTREWNGKGLIDLGVVEVGKSVEEVLIVSLRDCELATKFISPVLSLTLFFRSIIDREIVQLKRGEGGKERLKGLFKTYCIILRFHTFKFVRKKVGLTSCPRLGSPFLISLI